MRALRPPGLFGTAWLTVRYRSPLAGRGKTLVPHFLLLLAPVLLSAAYLLKNPDASGSQIFWTMARSYYLQFAIGVVMLGVGLGGFPMEESAGTMMFLLSKPSSRTGVLLGRIVSAGIMGILLVLLSVTASGLLLKVAVPDILRAWPGLAAATLFYGTVFTVIPLLTKRATAIGLVYVLIWEGFISMVPGAINSLTASRYLRALLPGEGLISPAMFLSHWSTPSHGVALTRLGLTLCVVIGTGIMVMRSKEYAIAQSRAAGEV